MIGAALFLFGCTLKNRLIRFVRRLRQPRYAAGSAVVAAYLFWLYAAHAHNSPPAEMQIPELALIAVSILAFCVLAGAWALPGDEPGLLFTEAEIEFLFPAPVTRRQLLAYKTLRTQIAGLISAVIFSIFVFRSGHYIGIFVALAFFQIYTTFVSFSRARLKLAGIGWLPRLAATAAVFGGTYLIAKRQFGGNIALIAKAFHDRTLIPTVAAIVQAPPLGTILWFPRWAGMAIYAPSAALLFISCAILLTACIVFFLLTVRLDGAFEAASIAASQRALARGTRMRAMRSGQITVHRFPPPFQLGDRGRPEVALVWKGLIATLRTSSFPLLALLLPLLVGIPAIFLHNEPVVPQVLGFLGLATAAMLVLAGPQVLRSDLRSDIQRLDALKSFPLSAERLIAAELIAPLVVLSLGEFLLVAVSFGILSLGENELPILTSPEFAVAALVFITPLCALQLLIQNAAVVFFPAWGSVTAEAWSFTMMGQRMLLLAGNLFVLIVALLPAALLFVPSLWLAQRVLSVPVAVLIASTLSAAIIAGEGVIGLKLVAWQFEKIDIANEV